MTTHLCLEFDRLPPEPARAAMCGWLTAHGIDPVEVPVPGWVERRPTARQVAYESFEMVAIDGERVPRFVDGDAVRVVRVLQLEARPIPFPLTVAEYAIEAAR